MIFKNILARELCLSNLVSKGAYGKYWQVQVGVEIYVLFQPFLVRFSVKKQQQNKNFCVAMKIKKT